LRAQARLAQRDLHGGRGRGEHDDGLRPRHAHRDHAGPRLDPAALDVAFGGDQHGGRAVGKTARITGRVHVADGAGAYAGIRRERECIERLAREPDGILADRGERRGQLGEAFERGVASVGLVGREGDGAGLRIDHCEEAARKPPRRGGGGRLLLRGQ